MTEWDAWGCLSCKKQEEINDDLDCPICDPPKPLKFKPAAPKKKQEVLVTKKEELVKVPKIPIIQDDEKFYTKLEIKRQ